MNLGDVCLKTKRIVSGLLGRHEDFEEGNFLECYVVHRSKAVIVTRDVYLAKDKEEIRQVLDDIIKQLEA